MFSRERVFWPDGMHDISVSFYPNHFKFCTHHLYGFVYGTNQNLSPTPIHFVHITDNSYKVPQNTSDRGSRGGMDFSYIQKEGNRAFWYPYNSLYRLAKNQRLPVSGRIFIRLNNSGVLISVRQIKWLLFYFSRENSERN